MAGNIRIPWDALKTLSAIHDLEAYKIKTRELLGNHLPKMMLNRLCLAVYITPDVLGKAGLIQKADDTIAEDIWQSKICLVVAAGSLAFKDDQLTTFNGDVAVPGDWVIAKINHCTQVEINQVPCRFVEDRYIESIHADPRVIW